MPKAVGVHSTQRRRSSEFHHKPARPKKPAQRRGDLDIEARIISQDKTHAVIALRVEKAFFRRHLHLLASLANIHILG